MFYGKTFKVKTAFSDHNKNDNEMRNVRFSYVSSP